MPRAGCKLRRHSGREMRGDCTGTVVAARIPPPARFARESRAFLLAACGERIATARQGRYGETTRDSGTANQGGTAKAPRPWLVRGLPCVSPAAYRRELWEFSMAVRREITPGGVNMGDASASGPRSLTLD